MERDRHPDGDPRRADDDTGSASEYVRVATVHGPIEEAQICSFLQSNGIPARIRGEAIRRIHGITVNGIGKAEVEVPRRFAATARELIETAERGELEIDDDFDGEPLDDSDRDA